MRELLAASLFVTTFAVLPVSAAAFSLEFKWRPLKLCTSGSPNTVANPVFKLNEVPAGTKYIRFKLKDNDAPNYNHGGGVVAWSGQDVIAPGAFRYKSPCPPSGVHTYVWTATAQKKKNGGKLATAKAERQYPE